MKVLCSCYSGLPVGLAVALSLLGLASHVSAGVEEDEELCSPQHVHISYGDSLTEMVLMWATFGNCSTRVDYGVSEWNLNERVEGTSEEFWEQNAKGMQFIHHSKLLNLVPSTTYFYRPISNNIGRGPFYFKTAPTDQNWSPEFLVFGDLGIHTQTIPTLVEEALKGEYTALLHIGDFAYNLKDDDGLVGDQFFKLIEPVAAYLPYMTCPGNHEIDSDTFTHYRHRFSMPQSPWPMSIDNLWYSFDVGPAHFISYSSEVFFTLQGSMVAKQKDWLVADLKKANMQRDKRPWIIAFGHRPMYCSTTTLDDCNRNDSLVRAGLEDVFYHYGVDIILQAHEHNYERLYPVYKEVVLSTNYTNPPAPVQVISGAAGSKHLWDPFQPPPQPTWSAVRIADAALNSFGRLHVINGTHAYWEQKSIHNDSVLDSLWIVQEHRGTLRSFNNSLLESVWDNRSPPDFHDSEEESQRDKQALYDSDKFLRTVIGVSGAVVFFLLIVIMVIVGKRQRVRYHAVRRWDPADLDYGKRPFVEPEDENYLDYEIDMGDLSNHPAKKLLGDK